MITDYRALLEHMAFISNRAMLGDFRDSAHVEYDMAITRKEELVGFAAFDKEYTGISVLHYGTQHMKQRPQFRLSTRFSQGQKHSCYKWNSENGCPKTEADCNFGHFCSKCSLHLHRQIKCRD